MKQTLTDITPTKYLCNFGLSCPAVFKTQSASYVVIGKVYDDADSALSDRVGPGEIAIEIPAELLKTAVLTDVSNQSVIED